MNHNDLILDFQKITFETVLEKKCKYAFNFKSESFSNSLRLEIGSKYVACLIRFTINTIKQK